MSVKIFVDLLSAPCRAVYTFAKKNNLPVSFEFISLFDGEHHKEEYAKVNPLKKVPGLKDGDFVMGESVSILQYLAEKFHTADHWFPKDLQKRAKVNEVLDWHHSDFRTSVGNVYIMKVLGEIMLKLELPKDKVSRALEELNSNLDTIENVFIKDRNFVAGDQISAADLMVIEYIIEPFGADVDVFKGRPKLSAWRERVKQAVGKELYDEAHHTLDEQDLEAIDSSKVEPFKPYVLRLIG